MSFPTPLCQGPASCTEFRVMLSLTRSLSVWALNLRGGCISLLGSLCLSPPLGTGPEYSVLFSLPHTLPPSTTLAVAGRGSRAATGSAR